MKFWRWSLLELLNKLVLQWFFVRLGKQVEKGEITNWIILVGVVPLTGWFSDYIGPIWIIE